VTFVVFYSVCSLSDLCIIDFEDHSDVVVDLGLGCVLLTLNTILMLKSDVVVDLGLGLDLYTIDFEDY
jgi:hypothetical protein